ncbi:MAG: rod shape-determining protein MreD [Actinobacteria bacterium]|nr:rod shape-determining protein MreD [Actinomycetota bacterium]NBO47316.1 rod shape-determining protein MreD [Actinomycetota bacterium]NBP11937.1 rod shape-determining protein MreD [Actinomycetota bacterium]NBP42962.1 rod shape-determining protein MreD [Actinomycetota bacterium]NBY50044.1 rod shape-determining protein MreD [Actinomycetota bacterium]
MEINRLPKVLLVFLSLFLIQEALINQFDFLIAGFSLYLAFFMAWVIQDQRNSAVVTGFIAGFILDLSPTIEAPFGLWTLVLTALSYLLASNVRAALDAQLSPLVMLSVAVLASSSALILFLLFGAILGQEVGSATYLVRSISGNALWSALLSPLYIPLAIKLYRATLTARQR